MGDLKKTILVALNDSVSSRFVVSYLADLLVCPENWYITLLHVFKEPSSTEELMGKRFKEEQPSRLLKLLQKAKDKLIENGYDSDKIEVEMITETSQTTADSIIKRFKKGNFDMVVIGRKRMSKAEEFVMGDISVKLVRALEGTAVLVVKSQ